ncbi:MAG: hypothetical protein V4622_00930 [Bacteroidota bacterium]
MKHSKKITLLTLMSFLSFYNFSQNVTYKVVKDQPDDVANYWVNIGLFDVGFAKDNPGFSLASLSLNSVVHYKNKFGGEFTMRKGVFTLSDKSVTGITPGGNFEIGAFYNLGSKSKSKNQKVILSSKKSGNTTTTVSMKVPGTVMRSFGIRAGFNSFKTGVEGDSTIQKFTGSVNLRSSGLYAGVLITSQLNLKSHTAQYGIKGAGFYRRTYIDVLFNPIRTVTAIDGFNSNYVDGKSDKAGAIGYRIGFEFLKPEPKKVQGNAVYQKLEIGSKPWNGYYVMYTAGINFKRKVKSMSSFKVVREME